MKTVNKAFLEDILSPLVGGGDIDELQYLEDLDSNNEHTMKEVIKVFLLPYFTQQSQQYQQILKETFRYYLTTQSVDFGRLIYSCLLPLRTFNNPFLFYKWIWEIFWPDENFRIESLSDYKEKDDIYEPIRYRPKK